MNAAARAKRNRSAWRQAAEAQWGAEPIEVRTRTVLTVAAILLDETGDHVLADWLLCTRPEAARQVATGVAVHALRQGLTGVWDALVQMDVADFHAADEAFFAAGDFAWSPGPGELIPRPEWGNRRGQNDNRRRQTGNRAPPRSNKTHGPVLQPGDPGAPLAAASCTTGPAR